MFEKFTEPARLVLVLAQQAATARDEDHLGTEHLLLALHREGHGVAAQALQALDISPNKILAHLETVPKVSSVESGDDVRITPHAKKLLRLSLHEAKELGHGLVDTEHLLLALLRLGEGLAFQCIKDLGVNPHQLRQRIIMILSGV
ncbi:Clp protease N-terminal domain-containing protein [Arthrobacter sp. MYb213]|uniref:Clp protease N-terminal domain-containing protein n=1 Tax=Arthrobacter sp. MYb213 TaxID=1848595 RepID=UPI000CFC8506|nr:Clp protease N-terminal domain-containing protein [Arthrobacter sp. MYb213]PRB68643.1 hypothetical protein CQ011_12945 [Arthrobacter sp. MYb213]